VNSGPGGKTTAGADAGAAAGTPFLTGFFGMATGAGTMGGPVTGLPLASMPKDRDLTGLLCLLVMSDARKEPDGSTAPSLPSAQ